MKQFGLQFHHLGLAVRSPRAAFAYLAGLGYREGAQTFDPLQSVNLAMRHHDAMPDVEVIWPGDGPSPVDRLVKRGEGRIYHLCYIANDPEGSLAALVAAGLEVLPVCEPLPAALFGGHPVSFLYVGDVGLIELIHPFEGDRP